MRHIVCILGTIGLLAGCAAPKEPIPVYSDIAPAVEAGGQTLVPPDQATAPEIEEESVPKTGILGFLKRKSDEAKVDAEVADAALPAEGEVAEAAAPAPQVESAPARRFSLFRRKAAQPSSVAVEPPATEAVVPETAVAEAPEAQPEVVAAAPAKRRFSLFRKSAAPQTAEPAPEAAATQTAMVAPEPETKATAPKRGGFFSRVKRAATVKPSDPDYRQVALGVTLPYGQIARLCDVPKSKLGKQIAKHPARGAGFTLYDSQPGATAPHSFYVTGFEDGCARQFTAALAMFGSARLHEVLRYGLPAKLRPYSETDQAYETLKRRVCGAGKGKPCGTKASVMDRDTVFVSTYERFESSVGWYNLLLHDGAVLAMDTK